MRNPFKLSVLLAALLFGLSLLVGAGVGAQDDTQAEFQPSDLEGIQYAVSRGYALDFSAMMDVMMASPDADMSMPDGIMSMGLIVIEFDSDGNAERGIDRIDVEMQNDGTLADDGSLEEFDIELGNKSHSYAGTSDLDGVESTDVLSTVQDGKYVYLAYVTAVGVDTKAITKDLISEMIGNDGSGEGNFAEDGASTGGLWDKLPASDNEMLANLIVVDDVIYPEPDGTPAA